MFAESSGQDGKCKSHLHAIVIRQTVPSESEAWKLANALIKEFAASDAAVPVSGTSLPFQTQFNWEDTPARGSQTFLKVSVERKYGGFHVYLYVSQDSPSNSALQPTGTGAPASWVLQ